MILIRRAILLAALAFAAPALAQTSADPAATAAPGAPLSPAPSAKGMVRVRIMTAKGAIVLDLNAEKAPVTTANFLRYVDSRRFDGISFYRASVAKYDVRFGVIQGGIRNDPAKLYPPIAHESTIKTGLKHLDGTISMGRYAPGSARTDFFICVGDGDYLDADLKAPKPKDGGDNLGFAAFGQVVEGMDVVRAILHQPVNPFGGPPGMKGEMLKPPIPILTVRRVAR